MKNELTFLDLASWSAFIVFSISSVILAVCLPEITKSIPINYTESGSLETFRNFVVLVILVLSIVLVRFFNKKQYIAQGQYLISAGLLMASFANNYFVFIVSILLVGIGGGLSEAFINPFVVDIHPQHTGRYLNLANAFYPIGVVVASILFGELLTRDVSWRVVFRIAAMFSLIAAVFINLLEFNSSANKSKLSLSNYLEIILSGKFWLFAFAIFLGGCIESALTFWSRSFVSLYLNETPRLGTLAVTLFATSMFVGRLLTSYLTIKFTLKKIILTSVVFGIVIGMTLATASSLIEFYILISLSGLATACLWPSILSVASDSLPYDNTTLLILLACMGVMGFGFTPLLIGVIGDNISLKLGFFLIPLFFALLAILLVIENKIFIKK